jgi:release factor glutamine methyltransferase
MPPPRPEHTDAPTRLTLLDWAVQQLEAADRDAPRRTAEWLLTEVLGCDRGQLYAHPERAVPPEACGRFRDMVTRCVGGEPLQHVLGYASFRGLRIQVSPAVMVPRPETEEVVEAALSAIDDVEAPRVLDIGTGSGCIALAIKHERPDAKVHAWDVSADALAVARETAEHLGLDVHFAEVDLFANDIGGSLPKPVDLLVSNPPYIPDEEAEMLSPMVHDYDPDVALFSGDDPLRFYRALADRASLLCAPNAELVFETHADFAEEAAAVLEREGLADVRVQRDLSGRPRILLARYQGASMV